MHVEAWLPRAAAARPDHPAINAITYAQLLVRARRVAAGLRDAGVASGSRVGLALPPSEDFAVALHGCLLHGAVIVPLDLRQPGAHDVDHLVTALPDGEPSVEERERHDLDGPAIVVHTSGTTSAPKPVVLSYGNWLWSALGSAVALGHPPDERWLCALPLTHVGGLSILLRSAIAGTTVLLHEKWDTGRVLDALDDATIVSLVPTTLRRLLDAGLREPRRLRWALLGGAPIPPALLDRAREAGVAVAPTYGLTEACSQVATDGVPLFCTDVTIAPDGEIVVRSPTLAPQTGGTLHTGDLGAWSNDGRLRITGRKADTIVTGGENVAPAEVEAVLEAHPAVAEAAVHGRPDEEWGEAVVAIVVPTDGHTVNPEELRAHAAQALAPYKVPKAFTLRTDPLPRTGSGKLLRRELLA
ncbi:MAG TPA: AMP-binding protein [Solirubrobacteraceae bacterium]|nr:AMP-binding protein [Solirubrobacteraceae bacterium]